MVKNYFEHPNKAVETDSRFAHVMAVTLDPRSDYREGIIRGVTSRTGYVGTRGFKDSSVFHKVRGDSLEHFTIGERLKIKGEEELIEKLGGPEWDFIGLEDPDIWIDEKTELMHVYFTLPYRNLNNPTMRVGLGHAEGKDLDSLTMTEPVLFDPSTKNAAKEVSIAPINQNGVRLNLVESSDRSEDTFYYSTVRVAIAKEMGKPWQFGETVFNPKETKIAWIAGHASPGPLLPETFINVGAGRRLGFMNGREANRQVGDKIHYGMFSVGLFIYDYEKGKIDWVSPEPLIRDSEAKTVTFASQFIETGPGKGILYAHVDDSFVRAYTLDAGKIKSLLPSGTV